MIRDRLSEYKNFPGIFREVFLFFLAASRNFPATKRYGTFRQRDFPLRNSLLCFFRFPLRGGVFSFVRIPRFPLRWCSVLFSSGFLHPSPRGFSVFSRVFSVRYATKKTPGIVREFSWEKALSFFQKAPDKPPLTTVRLWLRKRSSNPDRRWSRRSHCRTYNSPSRKPKADR